MRHQTIILYGAYGYTGKLIAAACASKKLAVILAGRNGDALRQQSDETGFPFEVVEISDLEALVALLRKGTVVIHCGGPFRHTARPMVEACLVAGTHYTDISGEYNVFEMLASFDRNAREREIMIMPGSGFDVVPSDCLALHLKKRLSGASHLHLAFTMSKGGMSRGTARSTIEGLGYGSMVRREGRLTAVPLGRILLKVDFGPFKRTVMNIPWGDISTAWRSTGIPNIEVFIGASKKMIGMARISHYFGWILRRRWLKDYLKGMMDRRPPGPDDLKRSAGRCFLYGRVWDEWGNQHTSTLETMNAYSLTAQTSAAIACEILKGNFTSGYQTPAMVYGADFILSMDGTSRVDR